MVDAHQPIRNIPGRQLDPVRGMQRYLDDAPMDYLLKRDGVVMGDMRVGLDRSCSFQPHTPNIGTTVSLTTVVHTAAGTRRWTCCGYREPWRCGQVNQDSNGT
jgi:hypothetical protein